MALRVSRGERGLADAAQPVQRRDRDAALVAIERRLDRRECIVAPHEMQRHADGDVRYGGLAGERRRVARSWRGRTLYTAGKGARSRLCCRRKEGPEASPRILF